MAATKKKAGPDAPPLPAQFKPWLLNALDVFEQLNAHTLAECERWLPGEDTDHAEYVDQIFDALHKLNRRLKDAKKAANKLPDES